MALIAVLWIVSLLALIAAGVGSSGRVSSRLAFNALENTKARALAEGGVHRAVFSLLASRELRARPTDGALNFFYQTVDGRVAIQVRDEDGKIDVNVSNSELLEGLLIAVGFEESEAARSMAERIIDYRDDDQDPLPNGAENPDYQVAGLSHGTADRPFRNLDELRSVLGMTDALYERLRPHMTIYADAEGFDPFWASDVALKALPGVNSDARSIIRTADVDSDLFSILPEDVGISIENYVLSSRELVFEVRALAETREGGRFLLEAVVALDGGLGRRPFTTYQWRRGALITGDPLLAMMQQGTKLSPGGRTQFLE